MARLIPVLLLALALSVPAYAGEACGGGEEPGLFGSTAAQEIFGLGAAAPAPAEEAGEAPAEECGDAAIELSQEPAPGMTLEIAAEPQAQKVECVLHTETLTAYRAVYGGVEYLLAAEPEVPDDAGRVEICHILTTDPGYVSPEGLRVGDTLERMREVLAEDGIAFNAGCAALPSGWNACFGGAAGTLPPGEGGLWPPDATITRFWK